MNGGGGGVVYREVRIPYEEVNQAVKRLKNGKAAGIDGIEAEMFKCGGDVITKWMVKICQVAWEGVPADWTKAIIVPVYKGKDKRGECGSYRGISLLSIPGKVYGKVIIEGAMTQKTKSVKKKELQKREMCGSDIFFQDGSRENISKRKKRYASFMDLEKAYDRVDWLALWEVLRYMVWEENCLVQ